VPKVGVSGVNVRSGRAPNPTICPALSGRSSFTACWLRLKDGSDGAEDGDLRDRLNQNVGGEVAPFDNGPLVIAGQKNDGHTERREFSGDGEAIQGSAQSLKINRKGCNPKPNILYFLRLTSPKSYVVICNCCD
jgi:hypothetical protein